MLYTIDSLKSKPPADLGMPLSCCKHLKFTEIVLFISIINEVSDSASSLDKRLCITQKLTQNNHVRSDTKANFISAPIRMYEKHLLDLKMTKLPMRPINSQDDGDGDHDAGFAATTEKPKLKQPPLYKVILINDDYTPMDFVVDVLRSFFNMNVEKATQIMLKVHTEGKGVCGVYSKDVAETKSAQVNDYSRECEQPLLCSVEIDR